MKIYFKIPTKNRACWFWTLENKYVEEKIKSNMQYTAKMQGRNKKS